jgi:hypothetical protein
LNFNFNLPCDLPGDGDFEERFNEGISAKREREKESEKNKIKKGYFCAFMQEVKLS